MLTIAVSASCLPPPLSRHSTSPSRRTGLLCVRELGNLDACQPTFDALPDRANVGAVLQRLQRLHYQAAQSALEPRNQTPSGCAVDGEQQGCDVVDHSRTSGALGRVRNQTGTTLTDAVRECASFTYSPGLTVPHPPQQVNGAQHIMVTPAIAAPTVPPAIVSHMSLPASATSSIAFRTGLRTMPQHPQQSSVYAYPDTTRTGPIKVQLMTRPMRRMTDTGDLILCFLFTSIQCSLYLLATGNDRWARNCGTGRQT